jgi:hypothetical protein
MKRVAIIGLTKSASSPNAAPRYDAALEHHNQRRSAMPLINVKFIEEVFTPDQKGQIVERLTDAMVSIEGENMRLGDRRRGPERRPGASAASRCAPRTSGHSPQGRPPDRKRRAGRPTRPTGQRTHVRARTMIGHSLNTAAALNDWILESHGCTT